MATSSKRNLTFLFGSGVSIPAGMPTLDEITEKVLSGEGIFFYNEIFSPRVRPFSDPAKKLEEEQRDYVQIIVKFLHRVKIEIQEYYKKHQFKSGCDYEDLYYIVNQIYNSEVGEFDNPAIQPLVDKILPDIKSILINTFPTSRWALSKLARETIKYIEYVVFHLLDSDSRSLKYLRLLAEASHDNEYSNVDIFTLNHDTVIEKFLIENDIQFTDGFFEPDREEHRYWEPSLFNSTSLKVFLFKLHGSINWFRFRREDAEDWSGESIIIPSGMVNSLISDANGRTWRALDKRPILLIGRYNKTFDYLSGIFAELHCQFYHSLRNVGQLIICGYGLGDRGINTQIIDWLYSSDNCKIIVVDPRPEQLKNKYLSSISNKWDLLRSTGKLRIIEKGIEKTSWQEIKGYLLDSN
jgi:hypothetical protein